MVSIRLKVRVIEGTDDEPYIRVIEGIWIHVRVDLKNRVTVRVGNGVTVTVGVGNTARASSMAKADPCMRKQDAVPADKPSAMAPVKVMKRVSVMVRVRLRMMDRIKVGGA